MPIVVKEWTRSQPLAAAREILRGERTDLGVGLLAQFNSRGRPVIILRRWTAQNEHIWWQLEEDGTLSRMHVPPTVTYVLLHESHYVFQLSADWQMAGKTWKADSVLSIPVSDIARKEPQIHPVLVPDTETIITDWQPTKRGLLTYLLSRGNSRLMMARYAAGRWEAMPVSMPGIGSIRHSASSTDSATAFVVYESFLQPKAVYAVDTEHAKARLVQSDSPEFAAEHLITEQWEARSSDGTLVPYSITRPRDMRYNGSNPVLMYGYGAMGGTLVPHYDATLGKLWLEHGGIYVLAGVRGGRERGAAWHVTRVDRRHTYADTIAIAEDLVKRGVTSAKRIGIYGQSAGGLLAAAVTTQRPDLFGAAILRVAVLDQIRVDLNGVAVGQDADEWGSLAVPHERAFLERTSPFQNLHKSADFPVPLIVTSATDERVPPAQSRRFAARMEALGMPFLFYESPEGSHAVATLPEQKARLDAWIFTYLRRQLVDGRAEG
jgi:prolyl oligopeptidase